ncbi:TorF family putative porin [Acidovorax sp. NCPPB 4044]|uniref:TorF family putative porin n=1 Tax=Acidovorax sp. NCPPB 4044 TaxID=2940490 RepID=UPI00230382E5|nr:TorF family putative porin [Acidovorax sp. NCPPB 4044]MDA8522962.1 TorF family putative porin [Acidovorax sp. NCPPB 4044]
MTFRLRPPATALLPVALFAACLAAPALARAQLTGNLALTSGYKFRGQDQEVLNAAGFATRRSVKPAVQGGLDYAFADTGWYLGNWNSSVRWLRGNRLESDVYGGYRFKAGPFDLDLGALAYLYPGNRAGNTRELYASAAWSDEALGQFTLKYAHTVSRDYFGYAGASGGSGLSGRGTGYVNLAYSRALAPQLTLKASLGYTRMSGDIRSLGLPSYADYLLGAAWDFGDGLTLMGALQGATRSGAYAAATGPAADAERVSPNHRRLVATLTKNF